MGSIVLVLAVPVTAQGATVPPCVRSPLTTSLVAQGIDAEEHKRVTEAIEYAEELWRQGDLFGRIEVFEKNAAAVEHPALRVSMLQSLADAYRMVGRSEDAYKTVKDAEVIVAQLDRDYPGEPHVLNQRCFLKGLEARIFFEWGLVDVAVARLEEAEKLMSSLLVVQQEFPDHSVIRERIQLDVVKAGVLVRLRDYVKLEEHVRQALEDPEYGDFRADAGYLHCVLGIGLADEAHIKPASAARARAELELCLSDRFGLTDFNRVQPELWLAVLALRESDVTRAQAWFDRATQHMGSAAQRTSHLYAPLWSAMGARLVLERKEPPVERVELEKLRSQLASVLRGRLESWSSMELRAGGYGFLQHADHRGMISELLRVEMALDASPAGVERALEHLVATGDVGTLARSLRASKTSLAQVRTEILGEDRSHALLVYFPGPDRSHVFAVGEAPTRHFELPCYDWIQGDRKAAEALLQQPIDKEASAARIQKRRDGLSELSATLLPSALRERLEDVSRLTVVGFDLLGTVPFEALPWSTTATVGTSKAVAHLPSLAVGLVLANRARNELRVSLSQNESNVLLLAAPRSSGLKFDEEQLEALLDPYPAERRVLSIGSEASIEQLLRVAPDACIIQVLTHGRYDAKRERAATFVLDADGRPDGMLVGADELVPLKAAPLVVLTACGSGRAPIRRGDSGAADLSGALFMAGARARCVVASAFDLDSEAALRVSKTFHQAIAKGVDPAESMRIANAELAADPQFADPFYHGLIQVIGIGHVPLFAK